MTAISRRDALKLTLSASATAATRRLRALEPAAPLSQLAYNQVQFAPGPLQTQISENHRLLLNLDEDSLLLPFRIREGRPLRGQELGGWYSTYSTAPACTFGQWVSGLSRFYAITGDGRTRAKIDRLIRGWSDTVTPSGNFYKNYKFPAYTYDKLVAMLVDANKLVGLPGVPDLLARCTAAAEPNLPPRALEMRKVVNSSDYTEHALDESYTLPENLFLAAELTRNPRYKVLAERFLFNAEFFDPLSAGENVLPSRHAYSHVNALSSAAMAYISMRDDKYFHAATNGFRFMQEQSFVTGGWGPSEHFVTPGNGGLGRSLTRTHASFEAGCGPYAHIKLARYLLRLTRDSSYGDSMERVLYNTVLGAKPINPDGDAFYYADYAPQTIKRVYFAKWPCCSGTLPLVAADYHISAFFQAPEGLYVNLYTASTVRWKHENSHLTLRLTTSYPYADDIRFEVKASAPVETTLFFRIPKWAHGASISVTGQSGTLHPEAGRFFALKRIWRSGDVVELNLPRTMRLEAVDPQTPNTVGLLHGPLALMRLDKAPPVPQTNRKWIHGSDPVAPQPQAVDRALLLAARQLSPSAHEWSAGELRFRPFPDISAETYTTYQVVS